MTRLTAIPERLRRMPGSPRASAGAPLAVAEEPADHLNIFF